MEYIQTTGWEDGVADLTRRLASELSEGKRVLWLVSGGSNIGASVAIMGKLTEELSKNLTIGLIDERYGPVSHADSNWLQLMNAGFEPGSAKFIPVLQDGLDLEATAKAYNEELAKALAENDVVIAQLGVGSDGHIAGILPNSPAAIEQTALVIGYDGEQYQRITTTPAAFWHFDVAYAFAFGDNKHQAIASLQTKKIPIREQPAQVLKELPEAYIYSDQLQEET